MTRTRGPASAIFGGHVVFRQGFKSIEIQGVEFYQLGQGGPHGPLPGALPSRAQDESASTFVADSSI